MEAARPVKHDFIDLRTRAELLELCGDPDGAARLRELSLQVGAEVEINCYAYQLLWRNLIDEAIVLLTRNVAAYPDSWNAWDSLAEAYEIKGEIPSAIEHYETAERLTEHQGHKQRIRRHISALSALGMAS
jgi:tetratricopeptide (TPR) repeat protein